eukprot:4272120-Amphidinium_carterae.1
MVETLRVWEVLQSLTWQDGGMRLHRAPSSGGTCSTLATCGPDTNRRTAITANSVRREQTV